MDILHEIENGITQKNLAPLYAELIEDRLRGRDGPSIPEVNAAIVERWSKSGLKTVKRLAWRIRDKEMRNG